MAQLSNNIHAELTDYVIKLLNINKIRTDLDFVREDPYKLARMINIDFPIVIDMQQSVVCAYSLPIVDAITIYRKSLQTVHTIPTGVSSLDEILVGGLMSGMFYEICGLSAAGKTQLCTTIAVNLAQIHKIGTLYVDCKGDLSGKRIHQMLTAQKRSIKDTRQTMDLIRRQQCDDADQLVDLLKELLGNIEQFEGTHRLLVVDSMPALWYLLLGDESSASKTLLSSATGLLRRLMVQHNMVILVVNLVTKWIDKSSGSGTSNHELPSSLNSSNSQNRISGIEMTTPGLGKYWQSVPSIRLGMAKAHGATQLESVDSSINASRNSNTHNVSARTIKVLKSTMTKSRIECAVTITDAGVV